MNSLGDLGGKTGYLFTQHYSMYIEWSTIQDEINHWNEFIQIATEKINILGNTNPNYTNSLQNQINNAQKSYIPYLETSQRLFDNDRKKWFEQITQHIDKKWRRKRGEQQKVNLEQQVEGLEQSKERLEKQIENLKKQQNKQQLKVVEAQYDGVVHRLDIVRASLYTITAKLDRIAEEEGIMKEKAGLGRRKVKKPVPWIPVIEPYFKWVELKF